MEIALPTAGAALALIVAFLSYRTVGRRGRHAPGTAPGPVEAAEVPRLRAVPTAPPGPPSPAPGSPELSEARVLGRAGRLMGVGGASFPPEYRAALRRASSAHHVRPEPPLARIVPGSRFAAVAPDAPAPRPALAETFALPRTVADRLEDPDDAVGLVRAILDASGVAFTVDGDVIRSEDTALVVLPRHGMGPVPRESLNHAYLRFRESGCTRGIVLCLDLVDHADARRRELLVPELRHAGCETIQRMADAVAAGTDPLLATTPLPPAGPRRRASGPWRTARARRSHASGS